MRQFNTMVASDTRSSLNKDSRKMALAAPSSPRHGTPPQRYGSPLRCRVFVQQSPTGVDAFPQTPNTPAHKPKLSSSLGKLPSCNLNTPSSPTRQKLTIQSLMRVTSDPGTPKFLQDTKFVQSKMYRAQLDRAATLLQSRLARGPQDRRTAQRLRIGHVERQIAALRARAVTRLQALVRGCHVRRCHAVRVLEHQLVVIEQHKQRDLAAIAHNKNVALVRLRAEFGEENMRAAVAASKLERKVQQANELIAALQAENKKIREKNDKLAHAMAVMMDEANAMELQISNWSLGAARIQEELKKSVKIHKKVKAVTTEFEHRIDGFRAAMQDRQEHLDFERTVATMMKRSVLSVVSQIEQQCSDRDLVEHVLDLAGEHIIVAEV